MPSGIEIERKFFIEFPDTEILDIKKKFEILQIYLENGENGSQRRVRRIIENGSTKYFYTEKIFRSAVVREENESEIDESEYNKLLLQKKSDCKPLEKCRYCFEYKNQLFEMDKYPFSDNFAILELELENPEQEIFFPEYINIVKEVTGISEYSNTTFANTNKFPEDSGD
ncbi:MAG: hypothetical protein K2K91_07740 [Ruminococcus sp.]|nr:hypothetical protein [Ruminococcus sp.]